MTPANALSEIQCSAGNWNYDPYMHGMANGLILAIASLKNEEPKFLDPPENWLCDNQKEGQMAVASGDLGGDAA